MLRFDVEDEGESFGMKPGWGKDVGASLAFEQKGEPERESGAARWDQRFDWALYESACGSDEQIAVLNAVETSLEGSVVDNNSHDHGKGSMTELPGVHTHP